jgi:hypothetical protein
MTSAPSPPENPTTLSVTVLLDGVVMTPPAEHRSLFNVAVNLMPGVKHLGRSRETRREAFVLVSGHAAECLLKAIATKSGAKTSVLKRQDTRHNLTELWNLAAEECSTLPTVVPAWLTQLDEFHDSPFVGRYMKGVHMYSLPAHKPVMYGLDTLLSQAKAFLGLP